MPPSALVNVRDSGSASGPTSRAPSRAIALLLSLATLVLAGTSRADLPPGEVAVPLPPPPAHNPPPPPPALVVAAPSARTTPTTFFALKAEGGMAYAPGHRPGGYGRFGAEVLVAPNHDRPGPVWGLWDAFEGWSNGANGGGSFPIVFFAGVRSPHVFATGGAGFNLITVDVVRDTKAAGIFSPRAQARLGVQVGYLMIAANVEVQRRWRWVLNDLTLFQAGITLGFMAESKEK
jgi:hypothetical protein